MYYIPGMKVFGCVPSVLQLWSPVTVFVESIGIDGIDQVYSRRECYLDLPFWYLGYLGWRGGGGAERGGRGVIDIMHGRSRTTTDPRTPNVQCRDGRSTSGFHRQGMNIACTKRERKCREVFGESHEG